MAELFSLSAAGLARRIASGEASCRQAVEAHLARIRAVNGYLNAVTVVLEEEALEAAEAADRVEPARRGPLHGVPFTAKESIDCLGTPTSLGIPALRHAFPREDAPVVERMKAAGAILIGRTNMSEFGMRFCADNPLRGATLNPWDPHATPGGSSGGEAAALAAGMTPFGLGNDMGGSLRVPAFCCGVAALKPTAGRIPSARSLEPRDLGPAMQLMLTEGPMARRVEDLRLGLRILSGRDIRDPRSVDAPLAGPRAARRAALVTRLPDAEIHPAILEAIRRAGRRLESCGWEVAETVPPELGEVVETWGRILALDLGVQLRGLRPLASDALVRHIEAMCRRFDPRGISNLELHTGRSRLARLWSAFFTGYPVVIGPTLAQPPWPVDADLDPESGMSLLAETASLVTPASLLGLPAVALPMGLAGRLPVGIQIMADLWREDLCLEAAELIEDGEDSRVPIDPIW
jgi:amidase